MFTTGALLLVFGVPRAYCVASACTAGAGHCDSQLIQTRVQPEEVPKTCFWTAGDQDVDDSGRVSECERDCVEQDKVCPFAEGKSCSCTEDFFPPQGEGELAASLALGNSTDTRLVGRSFGPSQKNFFGHRAVAPNECLSNYTNSSTYAVILVFAGRRSTMEMLLRYLGKMMQQCSVHEVHLWDYARDKLDKQWLNDIGKRRNGTEFQVMAHGLEGHQWTDVYEFYSSKKSGSQRPRWTPRSKWAKRENTVLVKADDDIVYIDTSRFDSYVRYIRTHHEKFIVHANIVNNGVTAYYQAKHIPKLNDRIKGLGEYPIGHGQVGMFGPLLLDGGSLAADLHRYFLSHRKEFSWSEPSGCIVYGKENASRYSRPGQGRFSINFFGARWAQWDNVSRLALHSGGDEHGISVVGSAEGKEQCIFTDFNVCHFKFFTQTVSFDIYEAYEKLSKQV